MTTIINSSVRFANAQAEHRRRTWIRHIVLHGILIIVLPAGTTAHRLGVSAICQNTARRLQWQLLAHNLRFYPLRLCLPGHPNPGREYGKQHHCHSCNCGSNVRLCRAGGLRAGSSGAARQSIARIGVGRVTVFSVTPHLADCHLRDTRRTRFDQQTSRLDLALRHAQPGDQHSHYARHVRANFI